MSEQTSPSHLGLARNMKIGLFHLGSGMADVLSTGLWNRVMISDLGVSATPVGLLVGLRYFLAPLSVWAGHMSDRHTVLGTRRLFWIWLGRAMMALSLVGLGLGTADFAEAGASVGAWALLIASMVLFSLGNALSGSNFLALVYDRAPDKQRGRAVGIVWTFLLLGFTVGGIFFGRLLVPAETGLAPLGPTLRTLFFVAAGVMSVLWVVSVAGEERKAAPAQLKKEERAQSIVGAMRMVWGNAQTRLFFGFLALSMAFAFAQDLILEPFAAEVFDMSAATTTRFSAYWGTTAILGTVLFIWLGRKVKVLTSSVLSQAGVWALLATFVLYAVSAFGQIEAVVMPGLLLLGLGLGLWNVGTLGMMMDMSPDGRAGTYLGFWTLVVTLSRGTGVVGGGILRDVALWAGLSVPTAYAVTFGLIALGMAASLVFLLRTDTDAFRASTGQRAEASQVFSSAMD